MTSEQTLLARGLLGSIVAISGYVALQLDAVWNLEQEQFDRYVVACMAVLRLGLFFVIFGILRIPPRGDVMNYYFPEALAWLHGRMPYRDFPSSYAPLHPFLDSLFVRVWHSEISLILFTILVEILMFYLAPRFLRKFLPENAVRTACILYLFSPISLQFVTIDGQDNVLIAFLNGSLRIRNGRQHSGHKVLARALSSALSVRHPGLEESASLDGRGADGCRARIRSLRCKEAASAISLAV
jgi:hypothetical protein